MNGLRSIVLVFALVLGAAPLLAQDKPAATDGAAEQGKNARRARAKKARRAPKQREEEKPTPESAKPPPAVEPVAIDDAAVRKEGEVDVKTVEFTGLDIEGQLKTPQLLYFLTRLRAEFGRPRLPHRSFMPELSRSSGEKALR